jgi:hypothetical protein
MLEIFKGIINIPVPFNVFILIAMFFAVAVLIGAITKETRKYFCHRQDIDFKRELVDRGLGGEEIERIVSARAAGSNEPVTTGGNYVAAAGQAAST